MTQDPLNSPDVTREEPLKPIKGGESNEAALDTKLPAVPFSMKGEQIEPAQKEAMSPINLAAGPASIGQKGGIPSPQDLIQQTQQLQTQIEGAKQQLQTPGLQFKPSTSEILSQHLNRFDDSLSSIATRLRIPHQLPPKPSGNSGVEQFLDYLTGGQQQLSQVVNALGHPPANGFQPGDLLALQVKTNNAQIQVNFFTVLLGKALSNIQTVMNIQN